MEAAEAFLAGDLGTDTVILNNDSTG
jgi:hypothetical protein